VASSTLLVNGNKAMDGREGNSRGGELASGTHDVRKGCWRYSVESTVCLFHFRSSPGLLSLCLLS